MTRNRKASTSCNHLHIDAIQDNQQKSIGDEWPVIGIAGSELGFILLITVPLHRL